MDQAHIPSAPHPLPGREEKESRLELGFAARCLAAGSMAGEQGRGARFILAAGETAAVALVELTRGGEGPGALRLVAEVERDGAQYGDQPLVILLQPLNQPAVRLVQVVYLRWRDEQGEALPRPEPLVWEAQVVLTPGGRVELRTLRTGEGRWLPARAPTEWDRGVPVALCPGAPSSFGDGGAFLARLVGDSLDWEPPWATMHAAWDGGTLVRVTRDRRMVLESASPSSGERLTTKLCEVPLPEKPRLVALCPSPRLPSGGVPTPSGGALVAVEGRALQWWAFSDGLTKVEDRWRVMGPGEPTALIVLEQKNGVPDEVLVALATGQLCLPDLSEVSCEGGQVEGDPGDLLRLLAEGEGDPERMVSVLRGGASVKGGERWTTPAHRLVGLMVSRCEDPTVGKAARSLVADPRIVPFGGEVAAEMVRRRTHLDVPGTRALLAGWVEALYPVSSAQFRLVIDQSWPDEPPGLAFVSRRNRSVAEVLGSVAATASAQEDAAHAALAVLGEPWRDAPMPAWSRRVDTRDVTSVANLGAAGVKGGAGEAKLLVLRRESWAVVTLSGGDVPWPEERDFALLPVPVGADPWARRGLGAYPVPTRAGVGVVVGGWGCAWWFPPTFTGGAVPVRIESTQTSWCVAAAWSDRLQLLVLGWREGRRSFLTLHRNPGEGAPATRRLPLRVARVLGLAVVHSRTWGDELCHVGRSAAELGMQTLSSGTEHPAAGGGRRLLLDDEPQRVVSLGSSLLIATRSGLLWCRDVETGLLQWSYRTKGRPLSLEVLETPRGLRILVASGPNDLVMLDAEGRRLWHTRAGAPILAAGFLPRHKGAPGVWVAGVNGSFNGYEPVGEAVRAIARRLCTHPAPGLAEGVRQAMAAAVSTQTGSRGGSSHWERGEWLEPAFAGRVLPRLARGIPEFSTREICAAARGLRRAQQTPEFHELHLALTVRLHKLSGPPESEDGGRRGRAAALAELLRAHPPEGLTRERLGSFAALLTGLGPHATWPAVELALLWRRAWWRERELGITTEEVLQDSDVLPPEAMATLDCLGASARVTGLTSVLAAAAIRPGIPVLAADRAVRVEDGTTLEAGLRAWLALLAAVAPGQPVRSAFAALTALVRVSHGLGVSTRSNSPLVRLLRAPGQVFDLPPDRNAPLVEEERWIRGSFGRLTSTEVAGLGSSGWAGLAHRMAAAVDAALPALLSSRLSDLVGRLRVRARIERLQEGDSPLLRVALVPDGWGQAAGVSVAAEWWSAADGTLLASGSAVLRTLRAGDPPESMELRAPPGARSGTLLVVRSTVSGREWAVDCEVPLPTRQEDPPYPGFVQHFPALLDAAVAWLGERRGGVGLLVYAPELMSADEVRDLLDRAAVRVVEVDSEAASLGPGRAQPALLTAEALIRIIAGLAPGPKEEQPHDTGLLLSGVKDRTLALFPVSDALERLMAAGPVERSRGGEFLSTHHDRQGRPCLLFVCTPEVATALATRLRFELPCFALQAPLLPQVREGVRAWLGASLGPLRVEAARLDVRVFSRSRGEAARDPVSVARELVHDAVRLLSGGRRARLAAWHWRPEHASTDVPERDALIQLVGRQGETYSLPPPLWMEGTTELAWRGLGPAEVARSLLRPGELWPELALPGLAAVVGPLLDLLGRRDGDLDAIRAWGRVWNALISGLSPDPEDLELALEWLVGTEPLPDPTWPPAALPFVAHWERLGTVAAFAAPERPGAAKIMVVVATTFDPLSEPPDPGMPVLLISPAPAPSSAARTHLSDPDLRLLLGAPDPRRAFWARVSIAIGLRGLSPFQHESFLEVENPTFVGRRDVIDDFAQHLRQRHYLLVGPRRVGKTSLLRRLFDHALRSRGVTALWLDLQGRSTPRAWAQVLDAEARRVGLPLPPWDDPFTPFSSLASRERAHGQVAIFFLNEIDGLLERGGEGPEFLQQLRGLADQSGCRFVMVGYTTALRHAQSPASPLFHFAGGSEQRWTRIGALPELEARELVGKLEKAPLALSWQNDEQREAGFQLLLARSYRLPAALQLFCAQLVGLLDDEHRPVLRLDDVRAIVEEHQPVLTSIRNTDFASLLRMPDRGDRNRCLAELLLLVAVQRLYLGAPRRIDDPHLAETDPAGALDFSDRELRDWTVAEVRGTHPPLLRARMIVELLRSVPMRDFLDGLCLTIVAEPSLQRRGEPRWCFSRHLFPVEINEAARREGWTVHERIRTRIEEIHELIG